MFAVNARGRPDRWSTSPDACRRPDWHSALSLGRDRAVGRTTPYTRSECRPMPPTVAARESERDRPDGGRGKTAIDPGGRLPHGRRPERSGGCHLTCTWGIRASLSSASLLSSPHPLVSGFPAEPLLTGREDEANNPTSFTALPLHDEPERRGMLAHPCDPRHPTLLEHAAPTWRDASSPRDGEANRRSRRIRSRLA